MSVILHTEIYDMIKAIDRGEIYPAKEFFYKLNNFDIDNYKTQGEQGRVKRTIIEIIKDQPEVLLDSDLMSKLFSTLTYHFDWLKLERVSNLAQIAQYCLENHTLPETHWAIKAFDPNDPNYVAEYLEMDLRIEKVEMENLINIYKLNGNEEFLPADAREMFLF